MNTIKKGSNEPDVLYIQRYLGLEIDGIFGLKTEEAVKKFQSESGLLSDGIVGPKSWSIILGTSRKSLEETDYQELADNLKIDVATIKAVKSVESGISSFEKSSSRPVVNFEEALFRRALAKKGNDLSGYTFSGTAWEKLIEAWKISREDALKCTSIGMFQILGSNYKACGYDSVYSYFSDLYMSESVHLRAFGKFLKASGLVEDLRNKNWAKFASVYNGKSYSKYGYDKKLEQAWNKYK